MFVSLLFVSICKVLILFVVMHVFILIIVFFFLLIFQLCFRSLSPNFLDLVLSNYLGPIDCRNIFIGGLARETTIGECFLFVLRWFVFFPGLPMSIRVINYFFKIILCGAIHQALRNRGEDSSGYRALLFQNVKFLQKKFPGGFYFQLLKIKSIAVCPHVDRFGIWRGGNHRYIGLRWSFFCSGNT
ncbi:hypothetical protein AAZV13_19G081700 [Glycine max]